MRQIDAVKTGADKCIAALVAERARRGLGKCGWVEQLLAAGDWNRIREDRRLWIDDVRTIVEDQPAAWNHG